jgi:hypothetical protein
MTIEQVIEVPVSRRIFLDLPPELPVGRAKFEFTVTPETSTGNDRKPVFGCAKGQFRMAEDFDEPLEDFKEYM